MENKQAKYDLEERLIDFACMCLEVGDMLPNTKAGINLEYQLSKSGTAAALIYGEAQSAESRKDFLHKIRLVLKEIRESVVNLKIIKRKPLLVNQKVDSTLKEGRELMAIFLTSVETAKKNAQIKKQTS